MFVCSSVNAHLRCVIPLMFRQVWDGFEQETLEAEELGLSQPTSHTTVFKTSQKELNPGPPPSDSSSDTHKHLSCTSSHTQTEAASVPLRGVAASFPDVQPVSLPPLSDCTSASQPRLVLAPSLSNISRPQTDTLPADNDSCVPLQSKSEPCVFHTNQVQSESNSTQVENLPLQLATHSSVENHVVETLQVLVSQCDSVV